MLAARAREAQEAEAQDGRVKNMILMLPGAMPGMARIFEFMLCIYI